MKMRRASVAVGAMATLALGLGAEVWFGPPASAAPLVTPKTQTPNEARALSRAFSNVAKALSPSVVRIDVESERPRVARQERRQLPPELDRFFRYFGDGDVPTPGPSRGTGSGLVIDTGGHILTNAHVVENAAKLTVTFSDGRELSAKVVGHDMNTDVAVLQLEKPPTGLVAARLGDSSKLEVGEWVLAIGSPLGLDQSVTAGIISGKGHVGAHVQMSGQRMREYIQTDAKINPGNSGGPLVNLDGEVVGMNTMINLGPGGAYGFAIPINQANRVVQALITSGHMRHAYLGILLSDVKDGALLEKPNQPENSQGDNRPKNVPTRAAWIRQILQNSPAQKAGLHQGDVITRIDSQKIESANDVIDYVSSKTVGDKVAVAYVRDGRSASTQIALGELVADKDNDKEQDQDVRQERLGLSMQTLTPDMARLLGVEGATKGAVVTEVMPGSRAAKAGLRAEDVIVEVNRKPVTTAEDAINALKENPKGGNLLRIRRGGNARLIPIPAQ
jgi:serine protease Do